MRNYQHLFATVRVILTRSGLRFQNETSLVETPRYNQFEQRVETMRYIIPFIVAAFLGLGVLGSSEAEAGRQCNCARCQQVRRHHQPNVFQKMMNVERRKNVWLKRTFLGR